MNWRIDMTYEEAVYYASKNQIKELLAQD